MWHKLLDITSLILWFYKYIEQLLSSCVLPNLVGNARKRFNLLGGCCGGLVGAAVITEDCALTPYPSLQNNAP